MNDNIHFSVLSSSFEHILFDLDGTLTESAPGIVSSVRYSLEQFNIKDQTDRQLMRFIGPPLSESYSEFYGFNKEQCEQAIKFYREHYGEKGIFENALYPDIPEILSVLKKAGKKLYIATSKPEVYMKKIISHFGIEEYFDDVCGGDLEEKRNEKWLVVETIIERNNLKDAVKNGTVLMIGDRKHDIIGSRKNDVPCCGVLWGYGNIEEFREHNCAYVSEKVRDLIG